MIVGSLNGSLGYSPDYYYDKSWRATYTGGVYPKEMRWDPSWRYVWRNGHVDGFSEMSGLAEHHRRRMHGFAGGEPPHIAPEPLSISADGTVRITEGTPAPTKMTSGVDYVCDVNANVCRPKTDDAKQAVIGLQTALNQAARALGLSNLLLIDPLDGVIGPQTLKLAIVVARKIGIGVNELLDFVARVDPNSKAQVAQLAEVLFADAIAYQRMFAAFAAEAQTRKSNAEAAADRRRRNRLWAIGGGIAAVLVIGGGAVIAASSSSSRT